MLQAPNRGRRGLVMQQFIDFLREKASIPARQLPHYQRWVKWYLEFAAGADVDPPLMQGFLAHLGKRCEEWQIEQARRAVQLYAHYRRTCAGAAARPGSGTTPPDIPKSTRGVLPIPRDKAARVVGPLSWDDAQAAIVRLMRLKHLSYRTEKTYVAWVLRLKSYCGAKPCGEIGGETRHRRDAEAGI